MGFRRRAHTPNEGTPPASSPSPWLPFDMPDTSASPKKLFAHYFGANNVVDNPVTSNLDYFAQQWIPPTGQGSDRITTGGYARNRPLPRAQVLPNTTPAWWQAFARTEITDARQSGVDGFFCDHNWLDLTGAGGAWMNLRYQALITVAPEFPGFLLAPRFDMQSLGSAPPVNDMATNVNMYYGKPSTWAPTISGTPTMIVSPFQSEVATTAYWTSVKAAALANHGITAKYLHLFLNGATSPATYAGTDQWGFGIWGYGADPVIASNGYGPELAAARSRSEVFIAPVWLLDCRPSAASHYFRESHNTLAMTNAWQWIIANDPDYVDLRTWNDYSEGSEFQKSAFYGHAALDISAYYSTRWKTGSYPTIVRDCIYLSYRNHVSGAAVLGPQTIFMTNSGPTAERYAVEALTFLTDPATLTVTVGGTPTSFSAPAGVARNIVTAAAGSVSATVIRSGNTVASLSGLPVIRSNVWQQDRHYLMFSSLRGLTLGQFDCSMTSAGAIPTYPVMTGGGNNVYVVDYANPQLAANAAAGKRLVFPSAQTYTVADLTIPANCYVEGNNSTLKFADNTTVSTSTSDAILHVTGSGVTIDNLNFDANAANQSGIWSQHRHCVRILGSFSNVVVKNCDFTNLIGDGVYVNTQFGNNIKIGPTNTFTANNDCRNGVSVVTGDTVEVFSNTFTNCSKVAMPGPIDIEPNSVTDHLAHIDVHDNTINSGTTAGPGSSLPGIVYTASSTVCLADDIKIRNNDISGSRLTAGVIVIGVNGGPFNASTGIVVSGNNVHDIGVSGKFGMELNYWIGADVTGNTFNGMDYGIYNYRACLGASTGNTFTGVYANITNDDPRCS